MEGVAECTCVGSERSVGGGGGGGGGRGGRR